MTDFIEKLHLVRLVDGAWEVTVNDTVVFQVAASVPGTAVNGLPAAGTTGQMLVKHSDVYYDAEWITPAPAVVGLGNVTNDAQLKRAAGDFATFAEVVVVADDLLLFEDTSDGGAKKKLQVGNLPKPVADDILLVYSGWEIFSGGTVLDALKDTDAVFVLWNQHMFTKSNPHETTKDQVGLGNVPNLDTTAAVSASHTHSNSVELAKVTDGDHDVRTDNPHATTKAQVGLTNVPDIDTTAAVAASHTHSNSAQLALVSDGDHDVRTDNPHATTKAQVGLTNVPDIDTTAAVAASHTHSNSAQLALVTDGDHDVRTGNPHSTTKAQVGLTNVTDAAQLTRGAGDWTAFTEATPAATDLILIEDADDGGAKKKVQVSSLPVGSHAHAASAISVVTSAFGGALTNDAASDTVQECLDKLDDHNHDAAYAVKALPEAIEICFDGGGATLTVDKKVDIVAKCAMTITGWTLLADQSGSVAIGVWKDTYANFPPVIADVLVTPAITTAVKAQASSLNLAVAAGDILRFNINSATTIQRVTLALTGVRA